MKTGSRGSSPRIWQGLLVGGLSWLLPVVARAAGQASAATEGVQLAGNSETMTLVIAIAKVVGSLGVVVGLMLAALHFVKKLGIGRAMLQSGKLIDIIDSRMIAPKKYVAVVRIADECVALGITDQQITLLTRVKDHVLDEEQETVTAQPKKAGSSFAAVLGRAAVLAGKRKVE